MLNNGLSIKKLRIAYLNNPDPVFYSDLDKNIQSKLIECGAEVIPVTLQDLYITCGPNAKFNFYLNKELFEFDAFFNYGYMSPFNDEAYMYILSALENANKFIIHKSEVIKILNNKLLQAFHYTKAGVNIPETFSAFSIPAMKEMMKTHFETNENSIIKKLTDYAGDGVKKCNYTDVTVNVFAKGIWNREYTLVQKMVPDSMGKSIRALIIRGKTYALAEYQDQTGDFRSNISFYSEFHLVNLMGTPKAQQYMDLAEKAAKSIGNLLIGGVDILDSEKHGPVVLEINSFPDLYDIQSSTGLDTFAELAKTFYDGAILNKERGSK